MADNPASSGLFAVFLLSIYSLVLIPYTIYSLCASGDEATTQPVVKVGPSRCVFLGPRPRPATCSQPADQHTCLAKSSNYCFFFFKLRKLIWVACVCIHTSWGCAEQEGTGVL
jgi:hypothetical protein